MSLWRTISGSRSETSARIPRGPDGYRAYAIGDIHGRLDLLNDLLCRIEQDLAARPSRKTVLVFLGDLIDRGPDSRGVLCRLQALQSTAFSTVFLLGNHEEILLRLLDGETGLLASWMRFGGAECAQSYGLDLRQLIHIPEGEAIDSLRQAIPAKHVEFLRSFGDTFRFGDYLFVHAGIRPGVELESQSQRDLRWIRADFLNSRADHGFLVVHGHTIDPQIAHRENRIGIDTGAYATGILTAIGLENDERWFLDTSATHLEQTVTPVD